MTGGGRRTAAAHVSMSAVGLALGVLADQVVGDPRRLHPVAGFGRLATALEQRTYVDSRTVGALHVGALVVSAVGPGAVVQRSSRCSSIAAVTATAAATWAVIGARSLQRDARTISRQLQGGDLAAARIQVRNLVGRETSELSAGEIARATVESLAENTSDAVVAPLFWGAVAGIPGLLGYRAINTLDAMIGHHSQRYERFGWAAARLDDVANWFPARLTGLLTIALAAGRSTPGSGAASAGSARGSEPSFAGSSRSAGPPGGGPSVGGPAAAWHTWRADAAKHPSPNAGVVEAAFAGALGVQLGGRNVYHGEVEDRGTLGAGRPVQVADIERAARLARHLTVAATAFAAVLSLVSKTGRPGRARGSMQATASAGQSVDHRSGRQGP